MGWGELAMMWVTIPLVKAIKNQDKLDIYHESPISIYFL